MTQERVNELKTIYREEMDYYGNIDFPTLQGKFRIMLEVLTEIEEVIKENENLKIQIHDLEEKMGLLAEDIKSKLDGEECE